MTTKDWVVARFREVKEDASPALDCSYRDVDTLPASVEQWSMPNLTHLFLTKSNIRALPAIWRNVPRLQVVYLAGNQLATLPDSFLALDSLTELNVSNNVLTHLPERFGELTSLTSLNLLGNRLTALPDSICKLAQLKSLNLSHNRVHTLPANLGLLEMIRVLNIAHNSISTIPSTVRLLTALETLRLESNPLPQHLINVCNKSLPLFMLYLEKDHLTEQLTIPQPGASPPLKRERSLSTTAPSSPSPAKLMSIRRGNLAVPREMSGGDRKEDSPGKSPKTLRDSWTERLREDSAELPKRSRSTDDLIDARQSVIADIARLNLPSTSSPFQARGESQQGAGAGAAPDGGAASFEDAMGKPISSASSVLRPHIDKVVVEPMRAIPEASATPAATLEIGDILIGGTPRIQSKKEPSSPRRGSLRLNCPEKRVRRDLPGDAGEPLSLTDVTVPGGTGAALGVEPGEAASALEDSTMSTMSVAPGSPRTNRTPQPPRRITLNTSQDAPFDFGAPGGSNPLLSPTAAAVSAQEHWARAKDKIHRSKYHGKSYDRGPEELIVVYQQDKEVLSMTSEEGHLEIVTGTVDRLVRHLADENHPDAAYIDAFLMTYRDFMTPQELLGELIARYNLTAPENATTTELEYFRKWKNTVQLRAINVIKKWMEGYYHDLNEPVMLDGLEEFLSLVNSESEFVAAGVQLKATMDSKALEATQSVPIFEPETTFEGYHDDKTLLALDTVVAANHLTIIEKEMFSRIQHKELILQFSPFPVDVVAPNLTVFVQRFNTVSYWVATEICVTPVLKKRVAVIKKFINIAARLHQLNNLNTMMAILSGLHMQCVQRLKETWSTVSTKSTSVLLKLERLMDPTDNYNAYRRHLSTLRAPYIPFVGVMLRDLLAFRESLPTVLPNGQINFLKMRQLYGMVREMIGTNRCDYDLPMDESTYNTLKYVLVMSEAALYNFSRQCERGAGGRQSSLTSAGKKPGTL